MKLRRLAFILAPALVAVTGIAPAQAQDAEYNSPIACIYKTLRKPDFPLLVKIVSQGLVGQTSAEKAEVDRIGAATHSCRGKYGWGKKKEDAALRWFAGHVLSENTTYELKKFGLDRDKLKAVVARLDAPTRAAYVSGRVSDGQSQATLEALKAEGIDFAALPAEERGHFAQKLSQGILGMVLQIEAEAAFSA
ncbi:MAG: hypothetical protein ACAH11_07100 [Sphingomonas sp.]